PSAPGLPIGARGGNGAPVQTVPGLVVPGSKTLGGKKLRIEMYGFLLIGILSSTAAGEPLHVDPAAGNSNFSAAFDAPLGERINAVSSRVDCDLTYDSDGATASGTCSVPLLSIMVDNLPLKTEHFQQWATHKKSDPKSCALEVKLSGLKLEPPLAANVVSKFAAEVPFTVCGRPRRDGKRERVEGTATVLSSNDKGRGKTVRVRARIEKFDREAYEIGPGFTEGWLARVQSLSTIVAHEGRVELSLFATAK